MTVESVKPFNAIHYTTSSGENCTATKKDGIVTIQGDKNGVRQMPLKEFMESFVEDQSKKTLERVPQKDTVSFSGKKHSKSNNLNSDMDINVKNGFLGIGKRTITGTIAGKQVELKLDTNFWGNATKLSGNINGKPVNLKLKGYNLEGNLPEEDRNLVPYLRMLMNDKLSYDNQAAMMAMMI